MRKILFAFIVSAVVGLVAASCAKEEEEKVVDLRRRSFEAWMGLYGDGAEKLASGIYVKKLKASDQPNALTPTDDCWVMINYTGTALTSGDVFVTRNPEIAKHQGTFEGYTHYTPDYVPFTPFNSVLYSYNLNLIQGNYLALEKMKEGDVWRVYVPSDLAYGANGYSYPNSGFGGQNELGADLPVIMDLELVKVIKDPLAYEANQVQSYAVSQLKMALSDTIRNNVYLKPISYGKDTATVKKDSVVSIYYVGRFLDGFVFDTNIEDTAKKYNLNVYYSSDKYTPLEVLVGAAEDEESTSDSRMIVGVDAALRAMIYGEKATVVFTSKYGYGDYGTFPTYSSSSGSSVQEAAIIPPYSPLIFDITVAPQYGDGSKLYPYTTYAIQHLLDDVDGVWVTGYVNGVVEGDNYSEWIDYLDRIIESGIKDNLMLANANADAKYKQNFPVELPAGKIRDALNIPDNEDKVYHKKIKLFGNIRTYKGARGLVNVTDYKLP